MSTRTRIPRTLAATAAEFAVSADVERELVPEVAAGLIDAGFARWFTPAVTGSFAELADGLREVAVNCPAAAWCGLVWATSGRMAAFLPERGQRDVWEDGPDVPIAASLMPAGAAERVPGGWRLTGEWHYLSGIDHARWALLCATAGGEPRYFAVPAADYVVKDTWFTLGMRGTGSRSAVLEGVTVPEHRTVPQARVWNGVPGDPRHLCYRVPLTGAHPTMFACPALGAGDAALALWCESVAHPGAGGGHDEIFARSAGELDAARLLIARTTRALDAGETTAVDAARNARDASFAADLVLTAVDRLFRSRGAAVHTEGDPLQRLWRDVRTATSHAALHPARNYALYAHAVRQRATTTETENR
ncbi:Flavin-dependent monooxygenase, oxygenase subunit HsaA [Actinomadura rubteroloni]|uniref:Flavin-dependent monooxygenase, oxygenase subunit HsaA n=1 Tax=Actinomadura rubteroloni TaxID=1926885 RepID=A0A2P4UCR0_9ACTN|nr:hydrolase [Actinomadura rubteroloni]POM22835.1 Flavin-dependent monooxygenase, oxygenase subunit HsaA [Actinomadura rubteroloni]